MKNERIEEKLLTQQSAAAIAIQSLYRGYQVRIKVKEAGKWTKQFDPATGQQYYHNNETREVDGERPIDLLRGVKDSRSARAAQIQSAFRAKKARNRVKQLADKVENEEEVQKQLHLKHEAVDIDNEKLTALAAKSQWCKYFDPRSKKYYYRHTANDIILWEKPDEYNSFLVENNTRDVAALSIQCAVRTRMAVNNIANKRLKLHTLSDSVPMKWKLKQLEQVVVEIQNEIDARTPASMAEAQQFPHLSSLVTEWKETLESIKMQIVLLKNRRKDTLHAESLAARVVHAECFQRDLTERHTECQTLLRAILLMNSYFVDLDVTRINAAYTLFTSWSDIRMLEIAQRKDTCQRFERVETLLSQCMGSTEFFNGSTFAAGKNYQNWHPSVAAALAGVREVEQVLRQNTQLVGGFQALKANKRESLLMSEEDLLASRLVQRQRHYLTGEKSPDSYVAECQKVWVKGLRQRDEELRAVAPVEDGKKGQCLKRTIITNSNTSTDSTLSNLSIWEATKEGRSTEVVAMIVAAEKQQARRLGSNFLVATARSHLGETLLGIACWWGHEHLVKYFLKKGASIDGIDSVYNRSSLLHDAARRGHPHVIRILLEHGLSVNVTDSAGDTPFHWAARRNNFDAVIALLGAYSSEQSIFAEEIVKAVRHRNFRGKTASSISKSERVRNQLKLAEEGRFPPLRCPRSA